MGAVGIRRRDRASELSRPHLLEGILLEAALLLGPTGLCLLAGLGPQRHLLRPLVFLLTLRRAHPRSLHPANVRQTTKERYGQSTDGSDVTISF